MVRDAWSALLAVALTAGSAYSQSLHETSAPTSPAAWAVRMADSNMLRQHPDGAQWGYTVGLFLKAVWEVGERTGDARYHEYVKRNMERFVQADGSIARYRLEDFNIDQVNAGKVLFPLHERTGDRRYRLAADVLRGQMRNHPRTSEGGFWHKQVYPHQMWLDGIYMGAPFLAQYARDFEEPELFDDVTKQVLLIARHTRDPRTGLFYHGWDESRSQAWADPQTGLSKNFWGRALGWYAMAIVDVLDYLPADHQDRAQVVRVLQGLTEAVAKVQDPVTGLWYQVLDQPNRAGNYRETSASSMFAYALAKGANRGYLAPEYREVARRAFDGLVREMVSVDSAGQVSLERINKVSGLGGSQQRDGSFEYYISEPIVTNDYKGVGPFILAGLELASDVAAPGRMP